MKTLMTALMSLLGLLMSAVLTAEPAKDAGANATLAEPSKTDQVDIAIVTSRSQPTAGSGLGVTARVTNLSRTKTVSISKKAI